VGSRKLLSGTLADASGQIRLVFPTPAWEDFVWLATAEMRHYGGDSMRVCQRLRSMLEHLIQTMPAARRPPLEMQLRLLNETVEQKFPLAADRNLIRTGCALGNGAAADA
jgi:uncharacterized membrane protein